MTLDIIDRDEDKPKIFRMWIKRIYHVSSSLSIDYSSLWEMTETEFLELEKIVREEMEAKQKKIQELRNNDVRE